MSAPRSSANGSTPSAIVDIPFTIRVEGRNVSNAFGVLGLLVLAFGLWQLDAMLVIAGFLVMVCSKVW
jgi:hypothetical protein